MKTTHKGENLKEFTLKEPTQKIHWNIPDPKLSCFQCGTRKAEYRAIITNNVNLDLNYSVCHICAVEIDRVCRVAK